MPRGWGGHRTIQEVITGSDKDRLEAIKKDCSAEVGARQYSRAEAEGEEAQSEDGRMRRYGAEGAERQICQPLTEVRE